MTDTTQRLEEMLAHQEQKIQDLSDMVTRQWAEIDRLKAHLIKMQDKITFLEENPGADNTGLSTSDIAKLNKPPHY